VEGRYEELLKGEGLIWGRARGKDADGGGGGVLKGVFLGFWGWGGGGVKENKASLGSILRSGEKRQWREPLHRGAIHSQ